MPNNGTIRLPLQTVGLHDAETILTEPEDPVPVTESALVATGVMSILPIETNPIVNPDEPPATAIGVDPIDDSGNSEPSEDEGTDESEEPTGFKSWQDYWDWLTGKVDDLWHKITSSGDEQDSR